MYDLTLNEYSVTCVKAEYICQVATCERNFAESRFANFAEFAF